MFTINVRKLFRKACGPWLTTSPPRSKSRSTARPSLEGLEDRYLLSASSLALPTDGDAAQQMLATLNQYVAQMTMVQKGMSNAVNFLVQEISIAQEQWADLLSIIAGAQAATLGAAMLQTGAGTTTLQQPAGSTPSQPKIKPQVSDGPDIAGPVGFLWDPTQGTNASFGMNWDYNMLKQNPATAKVPGQTADPVYFDPKATGAPNLSGNGGSAITWDYKPQRAFAMYVGGGSTYNGTQTINSGITVDCSVNVNTTSDLHLSFTDGTSKFQIDGNSTITNMHLGGSTQGQLLINSGTTSIAQSSAYTELDGASLTVGSGAILSDQSLCSLKFWASSIKIIVEGEMDLFGGPNTASKLIDINGNTKDYVDVTGSKALLKYSGQTGDKNTFTAPVMVEYGGLLLVKGGYLIVQGNVNGAAAGVSNDASVYMKDNLSLVQLSNSATLECDGDYYQVSGSLETTDTTHCTLQDGPDGALSTATIAGGNLYIADDANPADFGYFTFTCKQLNFGGMFGPKIAGNNDGVGTYDLLAVSNNLNLQGSSTLNVIVSNQPKVGQNFLWFIINAGAFQNNQFNTESSTPKTPLTYGPEKAGVYTVTFP